MTSPAVKRFERDFLPLADAISRLDIRQSDRDLIAATIADALSHVRDFKPGLFRLLASDPLVLCVGTDDGPCPDAIEIRVAMHLSTAPDGRAQSWSEERPVMRCVRCGATVFLGVPR